jgi:hypothetical protein
MTQIAHQAGATLHVYHHPGRAARHVDLCDTHNDRGTQFEAAQLEDDGTLRVTGHHIGPGVSEFFGSFAKPSSRRHVQQLAQLTPIGQGPRYPFLEFLRKSPPRRSR